MDRKTSSDNVVRSRRFVLGIVLIIVNLISLFKILGLPAKYIVVAVNIVIIIAVLVKFFGFTFSNMVVIFIIMSNFVYAFAILKIVSNGGQEPSTLTMAFYAFTTVELWSLSGITKKKEETKQKEIMYGDDESSG